MIISELLNAYNDFLLINYNEEVVDKLPKNLDIIAYQNQMGDDICLIYNIRKKEYQVQFNKEFIASWKATIKDCIEDLKNLTDLDFADIVCEYL